MQFKRHQNIALLKHNSITGDASKMTDTYSIASAIRMFNPGTLFQTESIRALRSKHVEEFSAVVISSDILPVANQTNRKVDNFAIVNNFNKILDAQENKPLKIFVKQDTDPPDFVERMVNEGFLIFNSGSDRFLIALAIRIHEESGAALDRQTLLNIFSIKERYQTDDLKTLFEDQEKGIIYQKFDDGTYMKLFDFSEYSDVLSGDGSNIPFENILSAIGMSTGENTVRQLKESMNIPDVEIAKRSVEG
ncbi:hypothetical protein M1328_04105 [Patescibacteria group bacterium]|nr:hypothetical protein [Patescibacteria group bacterium]